MPRALPPVILSVDLLDRHREFLAHEGVDRGPMAMVLVGEGIGISAEGFHVAAGLEMRDEVVVSEIGEVALLCDLHAALQMDSVLSSDAESDAVADIAVHSTQHLWCELRRVLVQHGEGDAELSDASEGFDGRHCRHGLELVDDDAERRDDILYHPTIQSRHVAATGLVDQSRHDQRGQRVRVYCPHPPFVDVADDDLPVRNGSAQVDAGFLLTEDAPQDRRRLEAPDLVE